MIRVLNIARNKYLLAGVAFVVWMCFFDRYDVSTQYSYQTQKKALEKEQTFYETEISRIQQAIHDVQFNANEIQKIAREKYKMKKDNEDIYIITEVDADK